MARVSGARGRALCMQHTVTAGYIFYDESLTRVSELGVGHPAGGCSSGGSRESMYVRGEGVGGGEG